LGIKLRLLALVLVAALPVLMVEVWSQDATRRQRMNEVSQAVLAAARLVASEQDQYFESARNIIATYLQSSTVLTQDDAGCSAYLSRLLQIFPAYTGFGVAMADGIIVCSSDPRFIGQSLADRGYFQETLATKGFAIGSVVRGPASGQRIVGMSYPLTDDKGGVQMVGVLGLDLVRLSDAMALPSFRPDSAAMVIDAHGTIMARAPDGEPWIGGEVTIRRPLKVLQLAIDRVGAGDLAARSGAASDVPEFARLGARFDRMAEHLERHEAEVQRANDELRRALAEKELLFREMNHRIKNSLQLVSSMLALQVRRLDDPEARRQLAEAQGRVWTVARIHERLYRTDQIETVEFGQYLRELCADIAESLQLGDTQRRIVIEATPAEVRIDQAVHLALVANELITNAFKHAYPEGADGVVEVRFEVGQAERHLEVIDRGVGVAQTEPPEAGRGIGMSLVQALVAQIEGRLTVERINPGTRFVVSVPA
jgi:two-component sensor histidine kinase